VEGQGQQYAAKECWNHGAVPLDGRRASRIRSRWGRSSVIRVTSRGQPTIRYWMHP